MRFTTAVYASFRRMVQAVDKRSRGRRELSVVSFPCDSTARRDRRHRQVVWDQHRHRRPSDVPMTVRAMKAGAVEFLTKPFKDDVLLDAIRGAIERSRAALRLDSEMRAIRNCYESLTPREREVMGLVVSGLLNKQVGGELGISEITVKAHRGQVMRKMQADSLADLVIRAARLHVRR